MNKILLFLIPVLFLSMSSCTSGDDNMAKESLTGEASTEDITLSQREFLFLVDSINKGYQQPETRGSQHRVYKATRAVLVGVVADGIGSLIGSGFASVLTSFAASTAYDAYLSWAERKMSRAFHSSMSSSKDIEQDSLYRDMNDSIKFVFCDNNPKTIEDSIGLMHNRIMNEVKMLDHKYNKEKVINYDKILEDGESISIKIGLPYYNLNPLDTVKIYALYNKMNDVFTQFQKEEISEETAFQEVEPYIECLLGREKAQFVSILSRYVFSCLGQNIELSSMLSYSKELNTALKETEMTEEDKILCKKLLQTMASSYTYWKCSSEIK